MERKLELVVTSGESAGARFAVPAAGLRLGRSSSNDIHMADGELSRNHCMFEVDSRGEITVVDLASANGTFVNGRQLGSEAFTLKAGDEIEAGATRLRVVFEGETPPPPAPAAGDRPAGPDGRQATPDRPASPDGRQASPDGRQASPDGRTAFGQFGQSVDLGLGSVATPAPAPVPTRRKIANALWFAAAAIAIAAAAAVLLAPRNAGTGAKPCGAQVRGEGDFCKGIISLAYEKIDADPQHIFRYRADIDENGTLRVVFDDLPGESRRVEREGRLSPLAAGELAKIFATDEWKSLEDSYTGPDAKSENRLKSLRLRLVADGAVKETRIENTLEPQGFRFVRERLETLINNELGLQSAQRSRDELVRSSAASEEIGDAKWAEREVEYGNISEALRHYRSAKNDLATVGSALDASMRLQGKIDEAEAELKRRYDAVRFEAERARQIGDWQRAIDEFRKLREMIPQKSDPRHAEASANLIDMEKRLEFQKKGGKRR